MFVQDDLLEIAFQKTLYETFVNFTDEDDPEGRPLKNTTEASDLENQYEEWIRNESFAYVRVNESASNWPLENIMSAIEERSFWKPHWIIHKGVIVNTYDLPATDEHGNVVGVRF